jgi:hypothetical protein
MEDHGTTCHAVVMSLNPCPSRPHPPLLLAPLPAIVAAQRPAPPQQIGTERHQVLWSGSRDSASIKIDQCNACTTGSNNASALMLVRSSNWDLAGEMDFWSGGTTREVEHGNQATGMFDVVPGAARWMNGPGRCGWGRIRGRTEDDLI